MEIALALSGGGYRASIYHLGVLQYLNSCVLGDDRTLLDEVKTISGVSGGALVALWYIHNEIKHEDRDKSLKDLYSRLCATNIAEQTIKEFYSKDFKGGTLVQALSNVYDRLLFDGAKFDIIMDMVEKGPIHHFSVEATDFSNGLPFRFQATKNLGGDYPYGLIGNKFNNVPRVLARDFKLCDIAAASSCFPMAFEPLVIDENYCASFKESAFFNSGKSIVLMDGGIVDNQAIDSIEKSMQQLDKHGSKLDLAIISDAVNPDLPQYEKTKPIDNQFKFDDIDVYINLILVLGMILAILYPFSQILFGAGLLLLFISVVLKFFKKQIIGWIMKRIPPDLKPLIPEIHVNELMFRDMYALLGNRVKSLHLMVSGVVMQHIRRQRMNQIYAPKDHPWLLNAQYNLKESGYWKQQMIDLELPSIMRPTPQMFNIADEANNTSTALWFSQADIDNNIPQKLLASGQFITCWNLLCYIREQNKKYPNKLPMLTALQKKMENDWEEYKANPYCRTENFVNK